MESKGGLGILVQCKIKDMQTDNDSSNLLIPQVGLTVFASQDTPVNFNYGQVYQNTIDSVNNLFLPNSGTPDQDGNLNGNIDDEYTVHHSMEAEKPLKVIAVLSGITGFVKFTQCDC